MSEMVDLSDIVTKVTKSDDFRDFDGSPEQWLLLMIDKLLGRPSVPYLYRMNVRNVDLDPVEILTNPDKSWRMGDGHHRVLYSVLMGFSTIPVVNRYNTPGHEQHAEVMAKSYIPADYALAGTLATKLSKMLTSDLKSDNPPKLELPYGWLKNGLLV